MISGQLKALKLKEYEFDMIESVKSVLPLAWGRWPLWQTVVITEECTGDDQVPPPRQGQNVALLGKHIDLKLLDDEGADDEILKKVFGVKAAQSFVRRYCWNAMEYSPYY